MTEKSKQHGPRRNVTKAFNEISPQTSQSNDFLQPFTLKKVHFPLNILKKERIKCFESDCQTRNNMTLKCLGVFNPV